MQPPQANTSDSIVGTCFVDGVRYYVKATGALRAPDQDALYLDIPGSPCGYLPNHPSIERLVSRVGRRSANVIDVRWPALDACGDLDPQWRDARFYLTRDAHTYEPEELAHQVALDAEAAHFVLNILTRNWDACTLNMATIRDLPLLFDFGESLNPALFPIERFTQVISRPHAMGHYCETYRYAVAYRAHLRKHLLGALDALIEARPTPLEIALESKIPEPLATPIYTYLDGALERLESDVTYVLKHI